MLNQIDVSNAFLHGNLDERVVVTQPAGFEDHKFLNHVCLLQKSLYGLKQSPRMWYHRLGEVLREMKFKESYSDPSLFVRKQGESTTILFAYVDDIVVTGSSPALVRSVITKLGNEFPVKDLGNLSFFWAYR